MKLAKILDAVFFTRDEEDNATGPSWKYRRKLIYGGYRLGFAMVIFGALTFLVDQWGIPYYDHTHGLHRYGDLRGRQAKTIKHRTKGTVKCLLKPSGLMPENAQ